MNITKDGWIQWAIRDPGPSDRWAQFGHATTPVDAIYHHSFEGWFNPVSEGDGFAVMRDPAYFPTAWHGTVTSRPCVFKGVTHPAGRLFQHYPINARLQHANGGNVIGPGFELEGLAPTPITPEQIATYRAIHRDIAEWRGMTFSRPAKKGLAEHREAPGAQTACPSERYAGLWEAIAAPPPPDVIDAVALAQAAAEKAEAAMRETVSLNAAIMLRGGINRIAYDPDLARVEQAAAALRKAGFQV